MDEQTVNARAVAVAEAMEDIRRIETPTGVTRDAVERIRDRLIRLSTHRDLFPPSHFPAPDDEVKRSSYLYRLSQDDDGRFALYVQSNRGRTSTPIHNHTTWAVVVGFAGHELNRFYQRTEDGVRETHSHTVEAGTGVAMLPDDLHAIVIDGPALNSHCYGMALERLNSRQYYDPINGTWKLFSNVGGIRG